MIIGVNVISVRSAGTDFEVDGLFLKAQREEKIIKNGKFSGTKRRACINSIMTWFATR